MENVSLNETFFKSSDGDYDEPSDGIKKNGYADGDEETEEGVDGNNNKEFTVRMPYFTMEKFHESGVSGYDDVIDVRTPLEFAEDRIPGSLNWPVLSNEERVTVGSLYAKDKMAARRLGAALISKNISQHIITHLADKPGNYKPLIYCWRGGQRSKSLTLILRQIGHDAHVLYGGYKEYRRVVRDYAQSEISEEVERFRFILMSGNTGNGKSRILEALRESGEQVLHLEEMAKHKGSVLGNYHQEPQPNQKYFETEVYHFLHFKFKPERVVWVEYESFKIGNITVPKVVSNKMLKSDRIHIEVDLEERIRFIMKDYSYLYEDKELLLESLERLKRFAGKKKVDEWCEMVVKEDNEALVRGLVTEYYDKCYRIPRGEALHVYHVPNGLITDQAALQLSPLVSQITQLGKQYLSETIM